MLRTSSMVSIGGTLFRLVRREPVRAVARSGRVQACAWTDLLLPWYAPVCALGGGSPCRHVGAARPAKTSIGATKPTRRDHAEDQRHRAELHREDHRGKINFHEWIGDQWVCLFSHPKDFTPVCTTELGYMAKIEPEFTKRNTKLIGLSVDPVDNHQQAGPRTSRRPRATRVKYPMIGDPDLTVAKLYNMLPAEEPGTSEGRTAATNATVRSVFVIGPDKKIKLMLTYPMTTGRNFDEILRVLDSMQLTAKHKVATPVNWKQGDDVIIVRPSATTTPRSCSRTAGRRPSRTCAS